MYATGLKFFKRIYDENLYPLVCSYLYSKLKIEHLRTKHLPPWSILNCIYTNRFLRTESSNCSFSKCRAREGVVASGALTGTSHICFEDPAG